MQRIVFLFAERSNERGIKMKIKMGDKVFLQRYDVAFVLQSVSDSPESIFYEAIDENGVFAMSGKDRFDFVPFKKESSIEWILKQEWILDLSQYVDIPIPDLKDLHKDWFRKYRALIEDFNKENIAYQILHLEELCKKADLEDQKLFSLGIMIQYLEGKINFNLPTETGDSARSVLFFGKLQ